VRGLERLADLGARAPAAVEMTARAQLLEGGALALDPLALA
jgi:hypothetical protein